MIMAESIRYAAYHIAKVNDHYIVELYDHFAENIRSFDWNYTIIRVEKNSNKMMIYCISYT